MAKSFGKFRSSVILEEILENRDGRTRKHINKLLDRYLKVIKHIGMIEDVSTRHYLYNIVYSENQRLADDYIKIDKEVHDFLSATIKTIYKNVVKEINDEKMQILR